MSNTLTNITATMVQDEVLPALKLGLTPINAISVELSTSALNYGDSLRVPIVSAKSAGTYSTTFASGDSTVATKSVTMEAPTYSSWYVNPNVEGLPTAERFLAQGKEAAYAVAKSVVQDVLKLFVGSNIGSSDGTDTTTIAAANYDARDQATLWKLIKGKSVTGTVSAVHTVEYASYLMQDAALIDRSASGSDVLMTGELPPILGASQYYTDAFPTDVTNENTGVIYTGKQTAAIGLAVPNAVEDGLESAAGVRIMQITDPDTGLSMVWRTWVSSDTGVYWGTVYIMKGQAFIQDAAVRIISS